MHALRYPTMSLSTLLMPLIFLLLFKYAFGNTLGAGIGGRYINYLTPGMLIIAAIFAAGSGSALESAREIPAHAVPVPDTASPALQTMIAAPLPPWWNLHPKSAQEWKEWVQQRAALNLKAVATLREKLNVKFEPTNDRRRQGVHRNAK